MIPVITKDYLIQKHMGNGEMWPWIWKTKAQNIFIVEGRLIEEIFPVKRPLTVSGVSQTSPRNRVSPRQDNWHKHIHHVEKFDHLCADSTRMASNAWCVMSGKTSRCFWIHPPPLQSIQRTFLGNSIFRIFFEQRNYPSYRFYLYLQTPLVSSPYRQEHLSHFTQVDMEKASPLQITVNMPPFLFPGSTFFPSII